MERSNELIDRYYAAMDAGDDQALAALYASDAMVIRFAGSVTGREAIADFLRGVRAEHQPFDLHTLDRVTSTDDVLMWDALVTTDRGVLATTDVIVLNAEGQIQRHILGNRGYWGR